MNEDNNASARALELVQEGIEILRRAEKSAPASPVTTFQSAKRRRTLRRDAARLREGKAEPRYRNLHTAEELADIYERTVQRDEMYEQTMKEFQRVARDLERILKQNPPGLDETMVAFVTEAKRAAEEQGPGSEAAQRYRHVEGLAWLGYERHSDTRRQRAPVPSRIAFAPDPSFEARWEKSAAELLTSLPPPDEPVIAFPPQGGDLGRGRILLRIGIRKASWIGSFELGHNNHTTVAMLPDDKHLFVSAGGAGYVIDEQSRTLVEMTGTDVVGTMVYNPLALFVVNHNGRSFEAFDRTGRIWKTDTISTGGFRRIDFTPDVMTGEARHPILLGWIGFSVKLATGEVAFDFTSARR